MTALRKAARAALLLTEAMREALPEVRSPDDKAKLVQLTSGAAQILGWIEVIDERQRIAPAAPEKAS
jgi:hypothetical protein